MMKHSIVLVDDHQLFRDGLKLLLNNSDKFTVVAEATNGKEFLNLIAKYTDAIILMDIEMPVMNGIEATQTALEQFPDLKIIALSMFGEKEFYYKMIEAGVKGFLVKNSPFPQLIEALNTVANGENCFSPELLYSIVKNIKTSGILHNPNSDIISDREIEILKLICEGLSNQEVGDKLFISKRTVDKHRANILEKTNTKNTANLVMWAIKHNIIKVD